MTATALSLDEKCALMRAEQARVRSRKAAEKQREAIAAAINGLRERQRERAAKAGETKATPRKRIKPKPEVTVLARSTRTSVPVGLRIARYTSGEGDG